MKKMTRVTDPNIKRRMGLPDVEPWYYGIGSLDEAISSMPDAEAIFSFDADTGKGSKLYHPAASRATFMAALNALPHQHAYEVVRDKEHCKCYWDVEYYSTAVTDAQLAEACVENGELMKRTVTGIIKAAATELDHADAKVVVLEGSRKTCISVAEARKTGVLDDLLGNGAVIIGGDGMVASNDEKKQKIECYKFSFHVVLCSIAFESNTCSEMRHFVDIAVPKLATTHPRWKPTAATETAPDHKVYGHRQNFRMLGSSKRGSSTALRFVNALCCDNNSDPLAACITYTEGLPLFLSTTATTTAKEVPQKNQNKKRRAPPAAFGETSTKKKSKQQQLPFPEELLQTLLIAGGDAVSTVGSIRYNEEEEVWQAQCDQKKRTRVCLLNPSHTHESNNCILFIKKDKNKGTFSVKYHCTGGNCAKSGIKLVLGQIRFDQRELQWTCDGRSSSSAAMMMTEEDEMVVHRHHSDDTIIATASSSNSCSNINIDNDNDNDIATTTTDSSGNNNKDDEDMMMITTPNDASDEDNATTSSTTSQKKEAKEIDPEDPDANSYDAVKERIEKGCFKVANPFCYAKIQQNNGNDFRPQLFSAERLRQYYANLYFFEHDSKGIMTKALFITRWMGDVHIREVSRIVCDPQNTDPSAYNMWNGFLAEKLPVVDEEEEEALVEPIVHHISRVMTDDNEEHTGWILDYLANILQRPHQKTQVAISLFGKQGCGKGILFDFFRTKILGENCSKQTSNPLADLFGGFASGLVNSVMVQIDEVTNLKDKKDGLKDLITSDKVRYEQKGKDCIVVQNLANMIFTSNNESTLSIAPDDRRFVLFKCSTVYMGNAAYFLKLANHLSRPEVARGFFQFLKARDLSRYPYHFQSSRPKTAYYRAAQLASIPVLMRFLSAVINNASEATERLGAHPLYNKYTQFYNAGNYKFKYILSLKTFAGSLEPITGITKRRSGRGIVYQFDCAVVKAYLIDNNEYDADAALMIVS